MSSDSTITEIDNCLVYIGKNKNGNEEIINIARKNQGENGEPWWFHFENISSCHLIMFLKSKPTKYQLCQVKNVMLEQTKKANTFNKLIYTELKNIKTTSVPGTVLIKGKNIF